MIDHGLFWGYFTHYIVDTDYNNYAIAYGCDNWFLFFHVEWATLLSREPFLEYPYVRRAKGFLDEINYPYDTYWVKTGTTCGFDSAQTLDEVMLNFIRTPPDMEDYGGKDL